MKKMSLFIMLFALMLSACAGVKATAPNTPEAQVSQPTMENKEVEATVPDTPDAKAAQAVVEKWIAAYQTSDADALLSIWSDDIAWTACADSPCASYHLGELKYYVPRDFKNPKFKVEVQSYLITTSGDFAIVQTLYTDPRVGLQTPTPAVAILEFEDGKILNEKWYW
jgi:hypothetical protein